MSLATTSEPTRPAPVDAGGLEHWIEARLLELRIGPVLALAAVARASGVFLLRNFHHPELHEWGVLSHNMLAGNGYSYYQVGSRVFPSAYMPPGYATFIFFLFRLFGEGTVLAFVIGQLVQAAAGILLVYLVYRIAEIYWPRPIPLLSALLAALYPAFIYMPTQMSAINLYIIVDAGVFYLLANYTEVRASPKFVFWAGLLMGLLILFRAEALGLLVLLAAFLLYRTPRLLHIAIFVFLALAVMSPWTIRNLRTFHRWLPVTTAGPEVLWQGNNPDATGSMWHGPPNFTPVQMPGDMHAEIERLPLTPQYEIQYHHIYLEYALRFILTHPRREVVLAAKKLLYYWTIDPNYRRARYPEYWVPSLLLVAFFWIGVISEWRLLSRYLLFSLCILFSMALGVVFYVLPRYRMGVEPFMIPFAAVGLLWVCQRLPPPKPALSD